MNSLKQIFLGLLASLFFFTAAADEGMWLPLQIKQMQGKITSLGGKLTPEDIYSINHSSIKDAIVQFGNFCTAEVVSDKGLLFTNHHCGYDAIASLSTTQQNHLDNGFWANTFEEELHVPGLTISFLVELVDVTERINGAEDPEAEVWTVESEYSEQYGENHQVTVSAMYNGSEYYVEVYKVYKDIRLVGAPPASVGKFGGDTDNWMWPRHTGDFSIFRVYAGADNEPADFSTKNKPLSPKHFLPVSLKGAEEGKFSMTVGFPGSTQRYLPSGAINFLITHEYPDYVKLMGERLKIMKADMDADESVRLALASDYASLSNTHKYFQGVLERADKTGLMKDKKALEKKFNTWVSEDPERKKKYGTIVEDIKSNYEGSKTVSKANTYLNVALFGANLTVKNFTLWRLHAAMTSSPKEPSQWQPLIDNIKEGLTENYKGYEPNTDKKVFAAMLRATYNDLPAEQRPEFFSSKTFTKSKPKKSMDQFEVYAENVYKKSILADTVKLKKFLDKPSLKKLDKDPGMEVLLGGISMYRGVSFAFASTEAQREELMKTYIQGLREMQPEKMFFPDANFSMRMSFGQVEPYTADGKQFKYYTIGQEILAKEKPGDEEFSVPEGLHDLLMKKDYGRYANEKGELPVCFTSSNDITGGNSGSPVIDGEGNLIGIAFDGNWESMVSDLLYEPDINRTISVDVRYVLFIIDKYAKCQRLIDELKLAN